MLIKYFCKCEICNITAECNIDTLDWLYLTQPTREYCPVCKSLADERSISPLKDDPLSSLISRLG